MEIGAAAQSYSAEVSSRTLHLLGIFEANTQEEKFRLTGTGGGKGAGIQPSLHLSH